MTFSDAGSVPVPAVHAPDQTPDFLALRAIMDNLGKATASGQGTGSSSMGTVGVSIP